MDIDDPDDPLPVSRGYEPGWQEYSAPMLRNRNKSTVLTTPDKEGEEEHVFHV